MATKGNYDKLMRFNDIMRALKVSEPILKKWVTLGMPRIKIDGVVLYDFDDVSKWLKYNYGQNYKVSREG